MCVFLCKYTNVFFITHGTAPPPLFSIPLGRGNTDDAGKLQKASCSHCHLIDFPHT